MSPLLGGVLGALVLGLGAALGVLSFQAVSSGERSPATALTPTLGVSASATPSAVTAAPAGTAPVLRQSTSNPEPTPAAPEATQPPGAAAPTAEPPLPVVAEGKPGIASPPPSPPPAVATQVALPSPTAEGPSPSASSEDPRVEQALAGLESDEERVGQLLLVGWAGTTAEQARPTLRELRPGGMFYWDNAETANEARAINKQFEAMATEYGLPALLITVDHEGGVVQRIVDPRAGVPNLGSNLQFARTTPSDGAACARGQEHARQLLSMGFHLSLAPVLDVNNNPNNPVIASRAYGADPELVARLGSAYIRGLQAGGVVAVGKHFPGHGNTSVDSHLELPILPHSEQQLEAIELVPFRRAIEPPTSLAAIMTAHIVFPAVDPSRMPATLSRPIMTRLLREKLGFEGLVMTDDLAGMKAITDNFAPGEAAVRSIRAGVDMLLIGGGLPRQRTSRNALLAALQDGTLSRERVDEAVRRVLRVKARFGLLGGSPLPEAGCP